ncbi:MAG: CbiX/SirB N-terminal domain-containing protein [Comamonadaceae bacterium]
MTAAHSTRATILLAHGSRDPLWHRPVEAVAERIRQLSPSSEVRCAYMEMSTPDLAASADELVRIGISVITIVPMFLGIGKHAREDIPVLLARLIAAHPQVTFDLRPAIGEDAQIIELMARISLS